MKEKSGSFNEFIQHIFIKHLLYAGCFSRCWRYKEGRNRLFPWNLHSDGERQTIKNERICWVVIGIMTTNKADEVEICAVYFRQGGGETLSDKVMGIRAVT